MQSDVILDFWKILHFSAWHKDPTFVFWVLNRITKRSHQNLVNQAVPSIIAQNWPLVSQVATDKNYMNSEISDTLQKYCA